MKKKIPVKSTRKKPAVENSKEFVSNTLSEALFGFNPLGSNGSVGTSLNQTSTLWINNRWYLVSNMRQLLSESYVEHGLIQTVVDVPVDDGFRGGIDIVTKELDPEEIEELKNKMEREADLTKCSQALKWNRLFGGAGVLIMTDQDSETPLDITAINEKTPLEFRSVDLWELFWDAQNTQGYNAEVQQETYEFYSYYGTKVHKSRVMKMVGIEAPSFIRPRLRGWGTSVVEVMINSINQYLKTNNLVFEVLDEFKVDTYKLKNLVNTLMGGQAGARKIHERIQLANQQKNYQHAIVLDSEDDFIQKELSFAGISETMTSIRMQIASDLRMPLTKVFGISAAGFSSGQDDIENYNSMVESQVRQKSKFDILQMVQLRCQQMFGFIPEDIKIEFKPLRVLSAEQEENVKTSQFGRTFQAFTAGLISVKEFKDACNKASLLPIQLDSSIETLNTDINEIGSDIGANEPDTKEIPLSKSESPKPKDADV